MHYRLETDMSLCTADEVNRLLPHVSPSRQKAALQFKHIFGQYCCLKSYCMLMQLLGMEDTAQRPDFLTNEFGKPYLPDQPYFSISHCKNGLLVAIDDNPIGVDIECIRHASDQLIDYTMSPEEATAIRSAGCPDRAFSALWTQKEALLKMVGTGIQSSEQLKQLLGSAVAKDALITTLHFPTFVCSFARKRK